jgi:cytochrome c-type biogenesis protein CcmH
MIVSKCDLFYVVKYFCLVLLLLLFYSSAAFAVEDRVGSLAKELRCLVCEGQAVYDSNSNFAEDVKKQITLMVEEGNTDQEIRRYFAELYGNEILYRPPVNGFTFLLWLAPLVFFISGFFVIRRGRK